MAKEPPTFEIGLAMAGAISAGAYSGGVFDFLCEALSEWEKAKNGDLPDIAAADVPKHRVRIGVMSGASAGALTGAVGLLALSKGIAPLAPDIVQPNQRYTLPSLYDAWVTRVDLASPAGGPDLLGLNDLTPNNSVPKPRLASALDSSVLDGIADAVIDAKAPAGAIQPPFDWIAKPLHLYMMTTNLRGTPYGIQFDSNGTPDFHVMQCHGDRVHFAIDGVGSTAGGNAFTEDDSTDAKFDLVSGQRPALDAYVTASLASSAFPIALAPRYIDAGAALYGDRQWPSLEPPPIRPHWPDGYSPSPTDILEYSAADGGVIDNEPFEYARRAIMLDGTAANDPGAHTASRAVIMIDPFPEAPAFDVRAKDAPLSFLAIPMALISAMKNQARFKPDEIRKALDPTYYSRYLIAPRLKDQDRVSSSALATGLLGGFGGFLDRSFREYDYQLGRYNCQRFLKEYFTLGDQNPIAYDVAIGQPSWPAGAYATQRDAAGKEVRIIPIYGSANDPVVLPQWPRITVARVHRVLERAAARANAVMSQIFAENVGSAFARGLLSVAWKFARGPLVEDKGKWALFKGLIETDQLVELAATDPLDSERGRTQRAVQVVAAALSDTGFDYWTAAALETVLAKAGFEGRLALAVRELNANGEIQFQVWRGAVGANLDCLAWADRRPAWVMRQFSGTPKVNTGSA